MAATLLSHGVAFGGTTGGPAPDTETNVTLDTTGATWILASYVADALHGENDPFTDSEGNTWTKVTGYPGAGDGHSFTSGTASFYWKLNPITSATHTFTATCSPASAHGCMEVMAWSGITAINFNSQVWSQVGPPSFTSGSVTAQHLAFAIAAVGYGDVTTNAPAVLTSSGWTVVDTLTVQKFSSGVHGACGITVAYKIFGLAAPGTTTAWTLGTGTGSAGSFMAVFDYTDTPPAPSPTVYAIRRLIRCMLPWDNANRVKFCSRLELIMQSGIGNTTATNPTVMLRFSDGGITWGQEIQMSAGELGDYAKRVFVNRLPASRNPVIELTFSDPVDWQLLSVFADLEEGTS